MSLARYAFYGSGLALCLSLSGCFGGAGDAAKTVVALRKAVESGTNPNNSLQPVNLPKISINLAALKPFPGGKGLIVCEPVTKSDASTAAFGAGCTRWLHLAVAGQGALGQTPVWDSLNAARRELKKPDLRCSPADAATLAKKLGVDYVATAEIAGAPNISTLTIRLWKMPGKTPVGSPISASGSQPQILAALPGLANKLSAAMAVPGPRLVPLVATPADMQFLGEIPWVVTDTLPRAQQDHLKQLAAKVPLAAVLQLAAMGNGGWDTGANGNWKSDIRGAATTLAKIAEYNTLALAESSSFFDGPVQKKAVDALVLKYPANYLAAVAEIRWHRQHETTPGRPKELAAAERAVCAADTNPVAWTDLAETISNLAQEVRNGRSSYQLDTVESAYLSQLYPLAYQATGRAAKLDPGSFYAQYEHSQRAIFAGHDNEAYGAIQKAIEIRPNDRRGWNWALEVYQRKWGGKTKDLLAVIDKVKADDKLFKELYRTVHFALKDSGLEAEANQVEADYVQVLQKRLASKPKDAETLKSLANTFYVGHRYQEAGPIFQRVTQVEPRNAEAQYLYGWVEHYMNRHYRKAEKQYLIAISLNPNYADAINALANITYYFRKDAVKAEALYRQAISLNDKGLYRAELARLLADTGRTPAAVTQANRAIRLGYTDSSNPIWAQLGMNPN